MIPREPPTWHPSAPPWYDGPAPALGWPSQRLNERGSTPGLCASCGVEMGGADAAETDGGQRVHASGCPVDEPRRGLRVVRDAAA